MKRQVSLNFSAASLAMARDGPRPRMNSDPRSSGRPQISSASGSSRRRSPCARCSGRSSKALQQAPDRPANARAAAGRRRPRRRRSSWRRRCFRARRRCRWRARRPRRAASRAVLVRAMASAPPALADLGRRDDVGAFAGLADRDGGRVRELQPGAVDRADRRTERRRPGRRRSARSHISGRTPHDPTSRARPS